MKSYKLNKMFQFLFPFFFIAGIFLIYLGFNDKENIDLTYSEDNSIKYNVYLKENSFFETPYLGENRTYIASLIDYIDVFFHYSVEYSMPLTGEYKYKYVALVRANKKDSGGYYWEKEYDLTEEKTADIKDNVNLSIDNNVKVKYSTYNDILNKFKKEYGVSTDGELKIIMKVFTNGKVEESDKPFDIDSEISLSIPLLEQSLEVSIDKDTSSETNILSIEQKSDRFAFLIFKITGAILIVIGVLGLIDAIMFNKYFKSKYFYELTIDKILKNYDSIIANVNSLPTMTGLKKIEVSNFNELLDVYNEVRMPINYYQDKKNNSSTFIIINDAITWVYSMKKDDLEKRVDSNEK